MRSSADSTLSALTADDRGCKIWPGEPNENGYPRQIRTSHGLMRVSRYVLAKKLGRDLLPGMCALHTCDVRMCVSENHLFEGTRKDNTDDMISKGRQVVLRGSSHGNSSLTEEKVRAIRRLCDLKISTKTEIARVFGVSRSCVRDIVSRKNWSHIR